MFCTKIEDALSDREATSHEHSADKEALEAIAAELNSDALDQHSSELCVVLENDVIEFA
jgi:hypothetical protein